MNAYTVATAALSVAVKIPLMTPPMMMMIVIRPKNASTATFIISLNAIRSIFG